MTPTVSAFDSTAVRKIRVVDSTSDTNAHMKLGWKLLGTFQHADGDRAQPVFVVGWVDDSRPENPDGWSG